MSRRLGAVAFCLCMVVAFSLNVNAEQGGTQSNQMTAERGALGQQHKEQKQ